MCIGARAIARETCSVSVTVSDPYDYTAHVCTILYRRVTRTYLVLFGQENPLALLHDGLARRHGARDLRVYSFSTSVTKQLLPNKTQGSEPRPTLQNKVQIALILFTVPPTPWPSRTGRERQISSFIETNIDVTLSRSIPDPARSRPDPARSVR